MMKSNKEKFIPTLIDIKIMLTIRSLNSLGYYPIGEGVYKILHGILDEDTIELTSIPTFKTVISLPRKKISNRIFMLVRYQYIKKIYHQKSDELYLSLTEKGVIYLDDFLNKHKLQLVKKETNKKPTIIKI